MEGGEARRAARGVNLTASSGLMGLGAAGKSVLCGRHWVLHQHFRFNVMLAVADIIVRYIDTERIPH